MNTVTGTLVKQLQDWGETGIYLVEVLASDREDLICKTVSVKVKKHEFLTLRFRKEYSFIGEFKKYQGREQFVSSCYCKVEALPEVKRIAELLKGHRFRLTTPIEAHRKWGDDAYDMIKRKAFYLMEFDGAGFKLCDNLYLQLGGDPNRMQRYLLAVLYTIENDRSKNTWFDMPRIEGIIREVGNCPDVGRLLRYGERTKKLTSLLSDGPDGPPYWDGDVTWMAHHHSDKGEQFIADEVAAASQEMSCWPVIGQGGLTDHQFTELKKATTGNIGILAGGGGVGKTYTTANLCGLIDPDEVLCMAFTGKACLRMREALAKEGVSAQARTIHSVWYGETQNRTNPMYGIRYLIVDEASMVSQQLFAWVMTLRRRNMPLIFVGDPHQLPPIDIGAPFRDLMGTVNTGVLTEFHRNAGAIVRAGDAMRRVSVNEVFEHFVDVKDMDDHNNLAWASDSKPYQQAVVDSCLEAELFGFDPVLDVQVIVAQHKTELGRIELNRVLQAQFNRKGDPVAYNKEEIRVNDKVLNTGNGTYECLTGEPTYVANGEIGQVIEASSKAMKVRLDRTRTVLVPAWSPNWILGYAVTVHKMQGSSAPWIVSVSDPGARGMFDRSMAYTQLTRAEQYNIFVGDKGVIRSAIGKLNTRKTFLKERVEIAKGKL